MVQRTLGFKSGLGTKSGLWRNEVGHRQQAGWTTGKRTQGPGTRLEVRSLAERANDGERVEKS